LTTIEQLDEEVLLDLSRRTDSLGVLSVYVNADPERWTKPRLTERLVERALATGARVSPVEGAARGVLSEAAGIGALLRW
jgi:hypothetical protein